MNQYKAVVSWSLLFYDKTFLIPMSPSIGHRRHGQGFHTHTAIKIKPIFNANIPQIVSSITNPVILILKVLPAIPSLSHLKFPRSDALTIMNVIQLISRELHIQRLDGSQFHHQEPLAVTAGLVLLRKSAVSWRIIWTRTCTCVRHLPPLHTNTI